jgi:hypothetical protein
VKRVVEAKKLLPILLLLANRIDDQAAGRGEVFQSFANRLPGRGRVDDRIQKTGRRLVMSPVQ